MQKLFGWYGRVQAYRLSRPPFLHWSEGMQNVRSMVTLGLVEDLNYEKEVQMEKKKLLAGVCSCCLISLTLLVSIMAYAAEVTPPVYRLKMQILHTDPSLMKFNQEFAEKIRLNTGGRVTVEVFASGTIVPTPQMASAVSRGTIDMAYTYGGYHAGFVDIANIESGLPMAWGNLAEAIRFHHVYGFANLAREAYDALNIRWISPSMETPFLLITKKPVRSIADMKPMKIRATAPIASILKQFGISTVYLPSEEFYTSLSTGVIDGLIYGSDYSYSKLKLQEQAQYITDLKLLDPMTSAIIINKNVWNSLSEELRGIIETTVKSYFDISFAVHCQQQRMAAKGIFKYQPFPAEDVAKLTVAAQKVWDEEAKKSPRAAKAVEMLKALAKESGRL